VIYAERRQELVDWEGHNQPEIELNDATIKAGVDLAEGENNLSGTDRNLRSEFNVASFCGSTCRSTPRPSQVHTHPEVMQILYCEICLLVTIRALVFNCYRVPNP
jgi:hypothetical protein